MPPSANGTGSGPEPSGRHDPPPISRNQVIAALGSVFVVAITAIAGFLAKLSIWIVIFAAVALLFAIFAVIFWNRLATWERARGRKLLKTLGPVLASAVIAFPAAWGANTAWSHLWDPARACGAPIDLRIVAAPETVIALRAAAKTYEQKRCPSATISVVPEPSIKGMEIGFSHGWADSTAPSSDTILDGPQPDIWIADSRIIAAGVRLSNSAGTDSEKANLQIGETVASSPMVIGLFRKEARGADSFAGQDETSSGRTLSGLFTELTHNRINVGLPNVLRAVPDTSEAALLATPALYDAAANLGEKKVEQTQAGLPEKALLTATAFSDGTSMLCYLRGPQKPHAHPDAAAVLLPEQAVYDYDRGHALGDSCLKGPTPSDRLLYPYYTTDLPTLDYTFVHVRWPGQDDAERSNTIEDFQRWLVTNSVTALWGFRSPSGRAPRFLVSTLTNPSGDNTAPPPPTMQPRFQQSSHCGRTLARITECYAQNRPAMTTTILLDVSGSMAQSTVKGGSRLSWAQQTGEGLAGLAHYSQDKLSFAPFGQSAPASPPPGPTRLSPKLANNIAATVARGYDRPLAAELRKAVDGLPAGSPNIVVLTDGQRAGTNTGYPAAARNLASYIHGNDPGVGVFFALTSGARCTTEPVNTLVGALRSAGVTAACVPASRDAAQSSDNLFSLLLQRGAS